MAKIRVAERCAILSMPFEASSSTPRRWRKLAKIYYLNIGDPVFFDFDTPDHVKQALFEAVSIYPLNLRFCGKNVYMSKGPFSRESLWRL